MKKCDIQGEINILECCITHMKVLAIHEDESCKKIDYDLEIEFRCEILENGPKSTFRNSYNSIFRTSAENYILRLNRS